MSDTTMPHNDNDRNIPLVSPVLGEGSNAHRLVRVGDWTLTVPGADGTDPEIPDTELAKRLGMELKHLRELSERHERAGHISPRKVNLGALMNKSDGTTYSRTRGRPGLQRFYNEPDALFLVTRSERPEAIALTKEMIRVYMLARRGLLVPAPPVVPAFDTEALQRLIVETVASQLRAASAPANLTLPVLDGRAKSLVLAKLMTLARTVAGHNVPYREVMRARGRIDRRVRIALNWSSRWCLYPTANLGLLLGALEAEERTAQQVAEALARSRQLSLQVAK